MATLSHSMKRTSSTTKDTKGIKALIMAASLAITLGGWGILATEQTLSAPASTQGTQVSSASTSSTGSTSASANSSTTVSASRRSTAPVNAVARTRSSR